MSDFLRNLDRALEKASNSDDPRALLKLITVIVGSNPVMNEIRREKAAASIKHAAAAHHAEIVKEQSDVELRLAVIDALVAEGIARPVAAERTRNPSKMLEEADRLGLV